MQFVYPSFLFALSAIAIPIIIHLFQFRRYKKVVFSDLRFLKQVQEETKSKQKLKDLLILLARILAIAFMVLAFAQPFLPVSQQTLGGRQKQVSLFIDNSFSMKQEGSEGPLLEEAKNKARAIVQAYNPTDRFQVLTHDQTGSRRLMSRNEALARIDAITYTHVSLPIQSILRKQQQVRGEGPSPAYILSDFQRSMMQSLPTETDSGLMLTLVPLKAQTQPNISVDSVWSPDGALQANTPAQLYARVRNHGNNDVEGISVTLHLNGVQKGLQTINLDEGGFKDVVFSITPGTASLQHGKITVMDHPVTFDDQLFFAFSPVQSYNVLTINGSSSSPYLETVFSSDAVYAHTQQQQNQLNFTPFVEQQCIVLNQLTAISSGLKLELQKYIEQGGLVVVVPATSPESLPSLNLLLAGLNLPTLGSAQQQALEVSKLNVEDPLFTNVFQRVPQNIDLPTTRQSYLIQRSRNTKGRALLELANGDPLIWNARIGKGQVLLSAVPFDPAWTNFQTHALFVPLMLKAGSGTQQPQRLYYTIGESNRIPVKVQAQSEKLIRLWGPQTELALQTGLFEGKPSVVLDQPVAEAGIFNLAAQGQQQALQSIALNYNRRESDMQTWSSEAENTFKTLFPLTQVRDATASVLQSGISSDLNGVPYWRYCVVLALVFLLIEILLLRLLP